MPVAASLTCIHGTSRRRRRNAECSRMTPKRKRRGVKSRSQAAAEHRELLEQLELVDSCCDICHCDCYSSHSSSTQSGRSAAGNELQQLEKDIQILEQLKRSESAQQRRRRQQRPHSSHSHSRPSSSRQRRRSASRSPTVAKVATKPTTATTTPPSHSRRGSAECCQSRSSTACRSRRSKSAGSQRSQSRQEKPQEQPQRKIETTKHKRGRRAGAQRDCQMLQVRYI